MPILAIEREVALPGGAGNVVRNLTALGAATAFISVVGDDQAGSGPDRADRRPIERGAVAAGAGRAHDDAEDASDCRRPTTAARGPGADRPDPPQAGRTGCCVSRWMRWRRPASRCCRIMARACCPATCRRSWWRRRARPAASSSSIRAAAISPVCRRGRGDAEPPGTRRRGRHAGGYRGGDRRGRPASARAARLRRGAW